MEHTSFNMIEIDRHRSYKLYWIDFSESQKDLVLNRLDSLGLKILDIGFELASYLKEKSLNLALNNVPDYMNFLLDNHQNNDVQNNISFVIIKNIGFLLEPFLQIDAARLLKAYSKNIGVILLWDGNVRDNSMLYWQNEPDYQINFSETKINKIEI